MEILEPLLLAAGDHNLTNLKFVKLLRARRDNKWYLHKIMEKFEQKNVTPSLVPCAITSFPKAEPRVSNAN